MRQTRSTGPAFYRRRWFTLLVAAAALFLLLLLVLPYGITYGLYHWLQEHGGGSVVVEDVDFNVFNGKAALTRLDVSTGEQRQLSVPRLELDVDWLPLLSHQIILRSLTLDEVSLDVSIDAQGVIKVGGIDLPVAAADDEAAAGEPWDFGLDQLEIRNTSVHYRTPDLQLRLHLEAATLSGLKTWATEPATVSLLGSLNGAELRLEGELPPLSSGTGYRGRLVLTGLGLHDFAATAATAVAALAGSLSIDTRLDVLQPSGQALQVKQQGMISVDDLALVRDDNRLNYGRVAWNGSVNAVLPAGGEPRVMLQGKLSGSDLALAIPSVALNLRQAGLLWDGKVTLGEQPQPGITAAGQLSAAGLRVAVEDEKVELASIDSVSVQQVSLAANGDLSLAGLQATAVVLAREMQDTATGGPVLAAGGISVDTLQLTDGNQVAIGTLEWRDVTSVARRESSGQWRVIRIINTLPFAGRQGAPGETAAAPAAGEPGGRVRVQELRLTGNSALELDDETVTPPFHVRFNIAEAVLRNIDNGMPEQDSPVSVRGETDRHSRIDFKGTLRPFAARPTLNLEGRLEAIALTPLSPYTVAALGYGLQSGLLDGDSRLKIDHGVMDISNKLVIRGLEVKAVNNASRKKLESQLSVPLDTALNMLRDKHDTIRLELPVKGDIEKPDFDISDVVNTAVSKALKKGSLAYLKLALQPYGALITVAQLAGEAATKVRLHPVTFAAGTAEISGEGSDYLAKVAGILGERPEINIKLCGVAVEEDRAVFAEQQAAAAAPGKNGKQEQENAPPQVDDARLLELARARVAAVEDLLISRDGVSASRLVACQPAVEDASGEGAPRVDLLI